MIFYDCRYCGQPQCCALDDAHLMEWARETCEDCGKENFVHMSRMGHPESPMTLEEISAKKGFSKI